MRFLFRWYLFLLLAILASSCKSNASDVFAGDGAFLNIYPNCEMNSSIEFLLPQGELRSGALINLNIKNTSKYSVTFPDDYNVKILRFDLKIARWLEIKNELQNVPSDNPFSILEPANSGLGSYSVVLIIPKLSEDIVTVARVVITGNFSDGNERAGECVGAFIDIEISP